jgi:catechol 2,3-dioxygenase-like lactoylglutathione lyase family enzyme
MTSQAILEPFGFVRQGHDVRRLIMTKMLSNVRIEARIPTQDLARARRWYAEKLGLEPVEEREGGLRYEGATGVFCLFASAGVSDGSFTQMSFSVDDVEAAVAALRARGMECDGFAFGD